MNDTDHDAWHAFPSGSADVPPGTGPLRGAREPGTAARRRHRSRWVRALVTAGAVVTVAGAGVTTALFAVPGSGTPSALAVVISALAETSAEGYSFSLDSTVQFRGRDLSSSVVSGVFGPGHEVGTELLTTSFEHRPVRARIRFVGKYVYTWVSPESGLGEPWNKAPVPPSGADRTRVDGLYGFVSDQPVTAGELSRVLRYAQVVHDAGPVSGPGWSGTKYTFAVRRSGGSVSGTAYVDHQGRVRRLVTITVGGDVATRRELSFGGFGVQEAVTAPPASQTGYTSYPYWGFYF
jgi:hypothetical protein